MEGLDISEFATTIIQLPIVGVFIWVVFRFMKEHREEREKMAADHKEERNELNGKFAESIDKSSDAITQLGVATGQFHTEVKEWRRENRSRASGS